MPLLVLPLAAATRGVSARMVKKLNCRKGGELSIPGVASPGGAGYDFLRQSIANRLAWRTAFPSELAHQIAIGVLDLSPSMPVERIIRPWPRSTTVARLRIAAAVWQ